MRPIPLALLVAAIVFYLVTLVRARRRTRKLAGQIRSLRSLAANSHVYRPPTASERIPESDLPLFSSASAELGSAGFTVLADLMGVPAGREPSGITRWFAAPDGRVVGWFGVARSARVPPGVPIFALLSRAPDGLYLATVRGAPGVRPAPPPFVRRTDVPGTRPFAELLAAHDAAIAASGVPRARLEVRTTADGAVSLYGEQHASISAWRASQPPAALLDADLREILGARHDELAPALRSLLLADRP